MRHLVILVLGFLTFLPAAAFAQTADQGMDPKSLLHRAASGDAFAAYYLGYLYQTGTGGLHQSYTDAIYYYQMAGKQDYVDAEVNLGNMYAQGLGVDADPGTAARWYYSASAHGNNIAENALGNLYYQGLGVPHDLKKAFDYYNRAYKHGSIDAAKHIGDMYLNGETVEKSDTEAVRWYTIAAKKGNASAQSKLAQLVKDGRVTGSLGEKGGIVELYKSAASKGDSNAQYNLGRLYITGDNGVTIDVPMAMKWFRRAASQGQPDAQNQLGHAYFDGKGVSQDFPEAWYWFTLAATGSGKETYGSDRDLAALKLTPQQLLDGQAKVKDFKAKQESAGAP